MGKRRGHNEGTMKQRTDGRWEAQVSLPGGRRKSVYGKTRKEAQDKLRAALRDLDAGLDLGTKRQTVAQFLDHWLNDVVRPSKAPKTFTGCQNVVKLYISPEIGRHQLGTLTPQHVAAMLKTHREAGPVATHPAPHSRRAPQRAQSGRQVGIGRPECRRFGRAASAGCPRGEAVHPV